MTNGMKITGNKIRIAIYAEHSAMAGRICSDDEMIERESDDLVVYEDDASELIAHANAVLQNPEATRFQRRCAQTIRNCLRAA